MKIFIMTLILAFSSVVYAGGSETRPAFWGSVALGQESVIETPSQDYASLFINSLNGNQPWTNNPQKTGTHITWTPGQWTSEDFVNLDVDHQEFIVEENVVSGKLHIMAPGGSETIMKQISMDAFSATPAVRMVKYVAETDHSVFVQLNGSSSIVEFEDAEVYKVHGFAESIGASYRNADWVNIVKP